MGLSPSHLEGVATPAFAVGLRDAPVGRLVTWGLVDSSCENKALRVGVRDNSLDSHPRSLSRCTFVHVGLIALVCALVLGRAVPGGLAASGPAHAMDTPGHFATAPVGSVSPAHPAGVRTENGWTLRSGKRLRAFPVAVGCDDPNDDETSDDPADDDDAWEDLTAFGETGVPVSAWLPEVRCYPRDPETQSDPLCLPAPRFTTFLTLQRLRC
jgi:hypothetical protein